ncbi:uncharacterized protein LOC132791416 [Drosophila nasuta]|uniref:uncharacterized protein LOC132790885 n=1 Tax=Drosophila nasuta TaxID=42062 RepID=UPI00295F2E2B|nr:uncharacterized protein LOC132790885 [Drosophila nasuta]XP_060656297.1 uncharacterized protein LOC132791416 [Drosophila nasuta]
MDISKLISEVEQRPALWDITHPGHGDRTERRFQWLGVALEMGGNAQLCQRKWQRLRRSYRRCVSLHNHWIHAEAMQFLGNGNRADADNPEEQHDNDESENGNDENDNDENETDDNYFFVISLLTTMRRMTPLQNIQFRTMVMDALRYMMTQMQQEQQEPSSTTH